MHYDIWDKVFKNGPSKICERLPLKKLKETKFLKGFLPQIILSPFLNTLTHIMNFSEKRVRKPLQNTIKIYQV